jgi:hypothetical protein
MRFVDPGRRLCVQSVLQDRVFLAALAATDIRERFRGVWSRFLCNDRRSLAQCSAPVPPYFFSILQPPNRTANASHTTRVPRVELEQPILLPGNRQKRVKSSGMRVLALFAGVAWSKSPVSHGGAFRPRDTPMSDEQEASAGHYREIAEKIRQLARQTPIPEAQQELFDLADRFDRRADLARLTRGRGRGRGQ